MRAVELNLKDPEFGAELVEVDDPLLPNDEWARVAVTVGGICGSDLHLFGNGELRAPALALRWIPRSPATRGGSVRCAACARPDTHRVASRSAAACSRRECRSGTR